MALGVHVRVPTCDAKSPQLTDFLTSSAIRVSVRGVSSVTAVPSYAGVPLTSGSTTGIHVVAAGARASDLAGALDPQRDGADR